MVHSLGSKLLSIEHSPLPLSHIRLEPCKGAFRQILKSSPQVGTWRMQSQQTRHFLAAPFQSNSDGQEQLQLLGHLSPWEVHRSVQGTPTKCLKKKLLLFPWSFKRPNLRATGCTSPAGESTATSGPLTSGDGSQPPGRFCY